MSWFESVADGTHSLITWINTIRADADQVTGQLSRPNLSSKTQELSN